MTLNTFEAIMQLCIRTKNYLKQWCDYAHKPKQIYSNGAIMHTNKKKFAVMVPLWVPTKTNFK